MKILLALTLLFTGLHGWSQTDTTTYQRFAAAPLQQDLDSIYLNLQWNHPHLFAYYKKADADAAFQLLRKQVTKPMNRLEFTRLVAPFIARFRDGHTSVDVSFETEEMQRYIRGGGRLFPLGVYILGGRLYAGKTDLVSTGIQKGDEIIALNGVQSSIILERLKSLWPADGEPGAVAATQRLFSYSLWVAYQWGSDVQVAYISKGAKKKEVLAGIEKDDFLKLTFNSGGTVRQLHLYPEYSLAVVEINSYGNVDKTNAFIDSCFAVIKEKGLKNITLDLRKNGGGNSYIGDYFIAHISQKPYNTVQSKRWHLSPLVLQLKPEHWLSRSVENARKTYTLNGAFLESPQLATQRGATLKDESLFVDGNLFLFTSPRTYSSAHMTALTIKCGGLGTIIDQPTGGRLNLTGELLTYQAPNSGLKIVIPVAAYTTACGDGEQIGVQPDHLVETTIDDIRAGRDPELIYLQKLLKARSH